VTGCVDEGEGGGGGGTWEVGRVCDALSNTTQISLYNYSGISLLCIHGVLPFKENPHRSLYWFNDSPCV
jgi:hypothetical protein